MIIEEQPMMVLKSLAVAIGLEEALVVQQMYWLLQNPGNGRELNGERWLYNTYEQWQETFFPFWSTRTLRRIFESLEGMHLVESCQPEGTRSRRKWYRLNSGMLQKLRVDGPGMLKNLEPAKLATSKSPDWPLPLTEMSFQRSEESKETSPDGDEVEVVPTWIPDERTKAQKLKTLRVPKGMPSERQFDLFLDQEDLGQILNYRPDLYDRLTTEKWHQWNERYQKWIPIRNWQEYVRALNRKIEEVF